jgi:hypothetical protein
MAERSDPTELLRSAGVPDPESWVASEIEEDIAQVARALLLAQLWPRAIDTFTTDLSWIEQAIADYRRDRQGSFADAGAALDRAISAGVEHSDLARIARFAAYGAVFEVLYVVNAGNDEDHPEAPGWRLMEIDPATNELTGAMSVDSTRAC